VRSALRSWSLVALAVALGGCAGGGTSSHGRAHWLRFAVGQGDPGSLNIHLDPSPVTDYVAELSQAYFARYDRSGKPVPELVTVIPTRENGGISADGTTIVWHLRHGVRWSDGAPFTAKDVAFTVRVINDPRNAEAQGTLGWDLIRRVEIRDPYTVAFHLSRPNGDFLPLYFGTAANEPCILPEHLLGSLPDINTADYNRKPVGIGPFRVVAWRHGDAVELERNPFYWRGAPKLERITIPLLATQDTLATQMQSGEIDLWPLVSPAYAQRLERVPDLHVEIEPTYRATQLDFVTGRPLVADPAVRRAIAAAIDRRKLIDAVMHGNGMLHEGPAIPLDPPRAGDAVVAYDPARARALLDGAGWRLAADGVRAKAGVRLVLEAVFPAGSSELDQTIEFVRDNLRAVGIGLESRKYAPSTFRAPASLGGILYGGKFDFSVYPRTLMAVSDVALTFGCSTIPPHGMNGMRLCDPPLDRILDRVEHAYDEPTRLATFRQAEARIAAIVPTIDLYVWKGGFAWNRRVVGFAPPILTPFDDMMNVDTTE
jgi:peptide/nickel transport system substrate-binding protein